MNPKQHFNNVLTELLLKTKWIKDNLSLDDLSPSSTDEKDKNKRWRCLSCDQLCGYKISRITLLNGTTCWDLNVENINENL